MSWIKTAELLRLQLDGHRKNFDGAEGLTGLPWFRAVHAREEKYRHQVDAICQKFIFSNTWPFMNKIQAHLVAYRLAWAMKLSLGLGTPFLASNQATVSFPDHLDEAQILHWLLIDTWSLAPAFPAVGPKMEDAVGVIVAESDALGASPSRLRPEAAAASNGTA